MREKDVSKRFEALLSAALDKAPSVDRPTIIAAAYILKELCLDIKRLSEAVEVLAAVEEKKLEARPTATVRPSKPYTAWSSTDDDIPF
jgi:hypothetical protein